MEIKVDCKLTDCFRIKIETPNMLIHNHYIECTGEELLDALFLLKIKQSKGMFKKDK